jgi:hypothetical protein
MTPNPAEGAPSDDVLPDGYWPADRVRAILEATLVTDVAPVPPDLSPAEGQAIRRLVAAAKILDDVFQEQLHPQAISSRSELLSLHEATGRGPRTGELLTLQDLSQGPITTTLENERVPFLPTDGERPGRNVYPLDSSREQLESFLESHPDERAAILDPCTVVRAATKASLDRDLAVLRRHPGLALLHPTLEVRLAAMAADASRPPFYAVPYSIAWADQLIAAGDQLREAAAVIQGEDPDFADFLQLRARDLLANDYEGGDAAWIRGRFGRLDAVIGPYETYDDDLFGVKTFFGMRILVRDNARSDGLLEGLRHLQAIEDRLPIDRHRIVPPEVPIGIFDAVADFGHQRSIGAIAEILPNDPDLLRKYGRRIVLTHNLITAPGPMARRIRNWRAATAPAHHADLTPDGNFDATVWHEIGHYLGPDQQADGRSLKEAFDDTADLLEELKAELLSAFSASCLLDEGFMDEREVRQIQAALLFGCLLSVRPNASQTYETLWLMLANDLFDRDVLQLRDGRLHIRFELVAGGVEAMLRDVLEIQSRGSRATAEAYIRRHSTWDERHESIATAVRAVEGQRFLRSRNPSFDD